MGHIIILTFFVALGSCFAMFIAFAVKDSLAMGVYAGFMSFGNIIIPTFIVVLLHRIIRNKTRLINDIWTILLQGITLYVLMMLGIIICAAGEAAIFETLTWAETKSVYVKEYSGFQPVVLTEAILIPTLDLLLDRNKAGNNLKKNIINWLQQQNKASSPSAFSH